MTELLMSVKKLSGERCHSVHHTFRMTSHGIESESPANKGMSYGGRSLLAPCHYAVRCVLFKDDRVGSTDGRQDVNTVARTPVAMQWTSGRRYCAAFF
jgi:hypothetical protein